MTLTIVVHSYRGGTGKSSVLANLALLLAGEGRRVGVIDTDIQSPTLDLLFRLRPGPSLADYLLGRCEIEAAAQEVQRGRPGGGRGSLYVVPARTGTAALRELMTTGYDVGLLPEGFDRLAVHHALDVLLLDTHAGLNNESVTAMASADVLLIMARADRIDLLGVEDHRPDRPARLPADPGDEHGARGHRPGGSPAAGRGGLPDPLAGILPYVPEMAALYGERIFSEAHPDHPLVGEFRTIISALDARDEVSRA